MAYLRVQCAVLRRVPIDFFSGESVLLNTRTHTYHSR